MTDAEHALSKSRSPSQESLGVSTSSQVRGLELCFDAKAPTSFTCACQCVVPGRVACLNVTSLSHLEPHEHILAQTQTKTVLMIARLELCICIVLLLSHLIQDAGCHRYWPPHVPKQPYVHPQSISHDPPSPPLCQHPLQSN